jgi:hypothetical protein
VCPRAGEDRSKVQDVWNFRCRFMHVTRDSREPCWEIRQVGEGVVGRVLEDRLRCWLLKDVFLGPFWWSRSCAGCDAVRLTALTLVGCVVARHRRSKKQSAINICEHLQKPNYMHPRSWQYSNPQNGIQHQSPSYSGLHRAVRRAKSL